MSPRDLPVIERDIPHSDDGRLGTLLRFPYNEAVIEELKELPSRDRRWTGDAWWVAQQHYDEAVAILLAHYPELMFLGIGGESDYIMRRDGSIIEQGGLFE